MKMPHFPHTVFINKINGIIAVHENGAHLPRVINVGLCFHAVVQPQALGRLQIVRHLNDRRRQRMNGKESDAIAFVDRMIDAIYLFKPFRTAEQAHGTYLDRHVLAL